jgi:hypothetical protein
MEACKNETCVQYGQIVAKPKYSYSIPTQITDHTATLNQIKFSSKAVETLLNIKVDA